MCVCVCVFEQVFRLTVARAGHLVLGDERPHWGECAGISFCTRILPTTKCLHEMHELQRFSRQHFFGVPDQELQRSQLWFAAVLPACFGVQGLGFGYIDCGQDVFHTLAQRILNKASASSA